MMRSGLKGASAMCKNTARIAELNDSFRSSFVGGAVLLTRGVMALSEHTRKQIVRAVQTFDTFTKDNDPYGEHDFGTIKIDGKRFFFQIAYYDHTLKAASPDPADPKKTRRVLTIMRASER